MISSKISENVQYDNADNWDTPHHTVAYHTTPYHTPPTVIAYCSQHGANNAPCACTRTLYGCSDGIVWTMKADANGSSLFPTKNGYSPELYSEYTNGTPMPTLFADIHAHTHSDTHPNRWHG